MNKYISPDFDVTIYEIEDIMTISIGDGAPDGGESEWWG